MQGANLPIKSKQEKEGGITFADRVGGKGEEVEESSRA